MSRLRRFRHLEGARPRREEVKIRKEADRFGAVAAPARAIACARCGDALSDPDAACPRCTEEADPPQAGPRAERFRTLAGNGSIPLDREVAPRRPGDEIAHSVPAWRGEAFSPEVAEEVRNKLGGAPSNQQAALRWAEEELARERRERLFILGASILTGTGMVGAGLRAFAALVALGVGLAVVFFSRACG